MHMACVLSVSVLWLNWLSFQVMFSPLYFYRTLGVAFFYFLGGANFVEFSAVP